MSAEQLERFKKRLAYWTKQDKHILEGRASELRQELVMCKLEGGKSTGPVPTAPR